MNILFYIGQNSALELALTSDTETTYSFTVYSNDDLQARLDALHHNNQGYSHILVFYCVPGGDVVKWYTENRNRWFLFRHYVVLEPKPA